MVKANVTLGKKIWPVERKLINRIITKQKGYHNKPYPLKNKIPTAALHSTQGALNILDQAEKKKPNKGHVRKYRNQYEHKNPLPDAHYYAYKKNTPKPSPASSPAAASKPSPKPKAPRKKETHSQFVLQRRAETPEQRSARMLASIAEARRKTAFLLGNDKKAQEELSREASQKEVLSALASNPLFTGVTEADLLKGNVDQFNRLSEEEKIKYIMKKRQRESEHGVASKLKKLEKKPELVSGVNLAKRISGRDSDSLF